MPPLNPAPSSLGLASPALGPWFDDGAGSGPTLALPALDLSVPVSLAAGMSWQAGASGVASYAFAATPRPPVLAPLRRASGSAAFADGALVVLLTLLPEVELRLAALTAQVPSPDNNPTPAGQPGRPPVRYLALEVPASAAGSIGAVERLREGDLPSDLADDGARAAYLGLAIDGGGALGNGTKPVAELHRPTEGEVIVKNRTGAAIGVSLWAFDDRGRALDPGAVANWWSFLAGPTQFTNLWASSTPADQRTASVTAQKTVLFCAPNEGPLASAQQARLTLAGLAAVGTSTSLFSAGSAPSVQVAAATGTDLMPVPRLALLPNGTYAAGGAPGTALFSGWTAGTWPTTITRDFARIAVTDLESSLVGRDRSGANQGSTTLRVNVSRNTAGSPFLATTDAAATQVTAALSGGVAAIAVTPVADADWGGLAVPALGSGSPPASLTFTVHALRGEGTASGGGGSVEGQRIVVRFPAGSLPAGGWVRVWTQGLDTTTGQRFRQDGGGALADGTGRAFVVTALPDGTAAPTDPADTPVRLAFDALVVTGTGASYYAEQRFDRPALVAGAKEPLPASPGNLPAGLTAWICEQGVALARAGGQLGGGQTLLAVPDDETGGTYALVDPATVADADVAPGTLRNAVSAGTQVVVTTPAWKDTTEGDTVDATGPVGTNGATVTHRTRSGLDLVDEFGAPLPTQERREVAAVDPAGGTGVVAATPGRAASHEAVPAQLGHAGVPASAEIHGTGVSIAGPLVGDLVVSLRERQATGLLSFITIAQRPVNAPVDPGGTSTFGAVLETSAHGGPGDGLVRAFLTAFPAWTPGQSWMSLKTSLESGTGLDIDPVLDTTNRDDVALAAAVDRVLAKTRDGAAQAATAILAAIGRAEDLVYLETPAIDALTAGSGTIDLVGALAARLAERPGLTVILCVPEKLLPGQPKKLEAVRKAGVGGALKALRDAAPGNVILFTPTAGVERPLHAASTTVIVDDTFFVTGSTHLWRRGLTFDTSLAVAFTDEALADARPAAVRGARRQLIGDRLAIAPNLVPDDPRHLRASLERLVAAGGLLRIAPNAYAAAADTTTPTDLEIWNPDGTRDGTPDWIDLLGNLVGNALDEINNAAR